MNRKSLTASLGSWYIHLIYNPHRNGGPDVERRSSLAQLYLPPYLAIGLGVGAGMQALAHFITLGNLTAYLMAALLVSVGVSYGARVGQGKVRSACIGLRWPFVIALLFLAISSRTSSIIPPESEGEGNSIVAVLVGLTTILSVLLVGARSGNRTVPLSAPLVPGLSLFGLLSLVSVDTIVQICFLLFVASALYVLSYERFLRRYVGENVDGTEIEGRRTFPSTPDLARWSAGALLVCSVWFGLFMVGGAILYYPVQAVLPRIVSPQLNRMRAGAQGSIMDYRGSSSVMELRGGNYVLSDREVMRITVERGESSGLWRGRVYERYQRSRWLEGDGSAIFGGVALGLPSQVNGTVSAGGENNGTLPPIDPELGYYRKVVERIEPREGAPTAVYASGIVTNRRDEFDGLTDSNDASYVLRQQRPYVVTSQVIQPRLNKLASQPGITPQEMAKLRDDFPLRGTLNRADDPETRRTISAVAQQIRLGTSAPLDTPYRKVRAVSDYLIQNCVYSLNSPAVPANQDAVVFFLTQSHEGACDMFASSMAMLLREMGVPSRIATGYLQPDSIPQNQTGSPSWILREKDAHAWVEYYVPGLGWLSYDPTVGTRTADDSISGQIAEFLALPTIIIPWRLLVLPTVGLVLLVVGLLWSYVEKRAAVRLVAEPEELERQRIYQAYSSAVAHLRRRVPFDAHLTPHEYDNRVSRSTISTDAKQEFAALTFLYTAARYQERPPQVNPADLDSSVNRLREALKPKHH